MVKNEAPCPYTRIKIDREFLNDDFQKIAELAKVDSECPYKDDGCDWKGKVI